MKVKTSALPADTAIEIQPNGSQWTVAQSVPSLPMPHNADYVLIKISSSTLYTVRVGDSKAYVAWDHQVGTPTTLVIVLSETTGSIFSVPGSQVFDAPYRFNSPWRVFIQSVCYLLVQRCISQIDQ
ncbi:hypothetical protein ACHAPT_010796 [Fusarium lateritium]